LSQAEDANWIPVLIVRSRGSPTNEPFHSSWACSGIHSDHLTASRSRF